MSLLSATVLASPKPPGIAAALGRWSAFAAALLAILFPVLALSSPPPPWRDIESYRVSFHPAQLICLVPVLLLAPVFVTAVVAIHYVVGGAERFFSALAVVFSGAYMVLVDFNYYVQLTAVRHSLLAGETSGLAILAMPNLHSLFTSLEALGCLFMGFAGLALAPLFRHTSLEKWICALLILNGVLSAVGAVATVTDAVMVIFAGLGVWCLVFLTMLLLALVQAPEQRTIQTGPIGCRDIIRAG